MLLGRTVDPGGQRGWVGAIQAGHRSEAIVAGIVAGIVANEYRSRAGPLPVIPRP